MPKNTPSRIIDNKQTRAVAFLGGSGSTGGISDHGLLTGLSDDDHAQYLRTDGTRTLTGNMAVAAAVTIDGIDISAHAADANAHHAQAHAITGSDHTVTGSQYQIVGLTSTNTLGLLTAASSPTTNQVVKTDGSSGVTLVDLTVTSDLFMTGTLDFGTNTIAEDATYLQFAGSKALRFAQNIGNANWTLYNAGGYTTTGDIAITGTAGDLDIGAHVLFVNNSTGSVGINCAPDSQFRLDIAGAARAEYWIGPHAIQLKNVLLLAHFDGRAPYETNYSGEPNGHMGQVAAVTGGVIYRPGKFYKALQMADAVTNLITNGSFETNTTGWSAYNSPSVFIRANNYSFYGSYGLLAITTGSGQGAQYTVSGLSTSTNYTLSAWVMVETARSISLHATDGTHDKGTTTVAATARVWTRLVLSFATDTHTSITFQITANGAASMWVDGVQLEARAFATPYCDGSLGAGYAWTGTAHASTSTRTATQLVYAAAGNIDPTRGTVMAWINTDSITGVAQEVLRMSGSTAGHIILRLDSTNKPQAYAGTGFVTAGSAVTAGAWTHLAMTWDGANVYLYVNGAYVTSGASSGFSGSAVPVYVGCYGATEYFNGLIDDLVILDRTMTIAPDNSCAEIRSVYESNAPVFAETSTFSFRPTPKGLIWADDEGLWMKDTAANPVFGIYGGDATKSWGGFTMAPGDLLIGNNAVGSSAILWDQSAGTFGFYGAGNATAQASVATDGSITAGAGALALNSSGIQITAPSTQTAIGAYKFLVTGKTITSGLYAYYNSGADTYYLGLYSDSGAIGNITTVIGSSIGGGGTSKTQFIATNGLASATTEYAMNVSTASWWFNGAYVGVNTAAAPTRTFQVNGGIFAGGDDTGLAGYTQITNSTQGVSSGTGTVKMNGTTARNSTGWLKIYVGTSVKYVPYFDTVTG